LATEARPLKVDGFEVNEVADGLVLYETGAEKVHYLNHTAAIVYELCTGQNSELAIAELLGRAYGLDEPPTGEVDRCLIHLRSQGVVA
jgi:hypothetical protein